MSAVWYFVLAAMLTGYAVLDGFDLGVGAMLPILCRDEKERVTAREAIGPVWSGNEVWLLAAGGAMFVAFPRLYAASFSGFYLPLMLVLWLFMLRGLGFEFRHAREHPMWTGLWDTVFTVASALLAILFGAAIGNVLRGVPLDGHGSFQGSFAVILNPFAILAGVLSLVVVCMHGTLYLAMKTEGDLQARSRSVAMVLCIVSALLTILFVVASGAVQPKFLANFEKAPVLLILPLLSLASLGLIPAFAYQQKEGFAFGASCALVITLLGSAAVGLFPRLLPALSTNRHLDLTIYNAAAPTHSLIIALVMNLIGMTIVLFYTSYIYRVWGGKVKSSHAPAAEEAGAG